VTTVKTKNERAEAMAFLLSARGNFIVSQALVLAIRTIKSRPKTFQEPSNVADMEYLLDTLFPIYKAVEASQHVANKHHPLTDETLAKIYNEE